MRTTLSIVAAAATLAASGLAAAGAGATAPSTAITAVATRHVEGKVTAIDRSARTFTVRDAQRGTLTVKVTGATIFERISGFAALRTGQTVDVRAKRVAGAWRATKVERPRPGSGGNHSGGADDTPGHTRQGRGADDPAGHR
ncbi:MAG: hypothetical protein QOJ82_2191 [Solirubrobacteraceae bacterium]|nr:hypothetical protein [Solirubrobacteraceae bacterium]